MLNQFHEYFHFNQVTGVYS